MANKSLEGFSLAALRTEVKRREIEQGITWEAIKARIIQEADSEQVFDAFPNFQTDDIKISYTDKKNGVTMEIEAHLCGGEVEIDICHVKTDHPYIRALLGNEEYDHRDLWEDHIYYGKSKDFQEPRAYFKAEIKAIEAKAKDFVKRVKVIASQFKCDYERTLQVISDEYYARKNKKTKSRK
jgi:hypothetical protein